LGKKISPNSDSGSNFSSNYTGSSSQPPPSSTTSSPVETLISGDTQSRRISMSRSLEEDGSPENKFVVENIEGRFVPNLEVDVVNVGHEPSIIEILPYSQTRSAMIHEDQSPIISSSIYPLSFLRQSSVDTDSALSGIYTTRNLTPLLTHQHPDSNGALDQSVVSVSIDSPSTTLSTTGFFHHRTNSISLLTVPGLNVPESPSMNNTNSNFNNNNFYTNLPPGRRPPNQIDSPSGLIREHNNHNQQGNKVRSGSGMSSLSTMTFREEDEDEYIEEENEKEKR